LLTAACTAYGLFTAIQPFTDFEPPRSILLPKLPLPWATIILLVAIIYILIEGDIASTKPNTQNIKPSWQDMPLALFSASNSTRGAS
jgi:hypothetical protein